MHIHEEIAVNYRDKTKESYLPNLSENKFSYEKDELTFLSCDLFDLI